jgi:hypothetical protein
LHLIPRERSLFFTPESLDQVRRDLGRLAGNIGWDRTIDQINESILNCFVSHGRATNARRVFPRQEPWMSFLAENELEVRNVNGLLVV